MVISLKKITDRLATSKAKLILTIICAVCLLAISIITPFMATAEYYYEYVDDDSYSDSSGNSYKLSSNEGLEKYGIMRAIECRDAVYSDLCMLGMIYLSNCANGKYKGGATLYENMYALLSDFGSQDKNIFGLDGYSETGVNISQTQYNITNIDSDYYYFYVDYNGQTLTNIFSLDTSSRSSAISTLTSKYDNYYLRTDDEIKILSPYDESGLSKTETYYSIADGNGGKQLTSEYIDSDKLLIGAAGVDSFGEYTFCFSSEGDQSISEYDIDEYLDSTDETYVAFVELIDDDTAILHYSSYYGITYLNADFYCEDNNEYYYFDYNPSLDETIDRSDERFSKYVSILGGAADSDNNWILAEDMPEYSFTSLDTSKLTVFMAPKTDIVASATSFLNSYRIQKNVFCVLNVFFKVIWLLALAIFVFASIKSPVLAYCSERSDKLDNIFRIDLCLVIFVISLFIFIVSDPIADFITRTNIYEILSTFLLQITFLVISHTIALFSIDMIIRQLKLREKGTLPKLLISTIYKRYEQTRFVKWKNKISIKKRFIIRTIIFVVLCPVIPLALLALFNLFDMNKGDTLVFTALVTEALWCIIYLRYLFKIVNDIARLEKKIDRMISDEEYVQDEKLIINPGSSLFSISQKLDNLSQIEQQVIENQVQAERMKVELLTNVSHDLKTPLTSIVSYVDLLDKAELSEEASDYVKIISKKSDKLRDIVSDVFTLAKAVSGVEVENEPLDFAILMRQVLADNEDKTKNSGRDLRVEIKPTSAPIIGDGSKLYRVIQNLLDNALKYSLEGTRIYLTLTQDDLGFEFLIKNISRDEMSFTADEITERFTRGDKSRTDGGSGLGLSIAKTFTEAQGGEFKVEIDGDVFAAYVRFKQREDADERTEPLDENN